MIIVNFLVASIHPVTVILLVAGAASLFELIVFLPLLFLMEIRKVERGYEEFEKEKQEFLADPERKLKRYSSQVVSAAMALIWHFPLFTPGAKNQLIDRIISELSTEKDH
jgi:hypothetical protein